jgi:inhibitor of KinA sporulation pathway (predicted exonuclease)
MLFCTIDFEVTVNVNKIEIIEFSSILINVERNDIIEIDKFHKYVKPTENKILSYECTRLTKISQEEINNAETLDIIIKQHLEWLKSKCEKEVFFISCIDWNFTHLTEELERKNIEIDEIYMKYINLKDEFERFYGITSNSMVNMLAFLGLERIDGLHNGLDNGLDNTVNITNIFKKMIEDGFDNFTLNVYK